MGADELEDLDDLDAEARRMHAELSGRDVPTAPALELDVDAMRPVARRTPSVALVRAPVAPPAPTIARMERPLVGSRLAHDDPMSRLVTLPLAFILCALLVSTDLGRLLATPISIQFHELGHALVAFLTGRFALPMPWGFTFWSAEPSLAAHLMVMLVSTLLVLRGLQERAPFPLALALGLELAHAFFALVVRDDEAAILLAGGAAELVLPGLAMVSFYFRMPDRVRWDFFRFLVVPAGAVAYCAGMRLWLSVLAGRMSAPLGSLLGLPGDGSGDLDRLVHDHGYALGAIVRGNVTLGIFVGAIVFVVYGVFALRALATLRAELR